MSQIKYRNIDFTIAFQEFHPPLPLSLFATDGFLNTYKRITGTDVGFIYEVVDSELTGYMQTDSAEIIWESIKNTLTLEWLNTEFKNFENHVDELKQRIEPARVREYTRSELIDLFESIYSETGEIYPYTNAFYMLSSEIESQIIAKLKNTYSEDEAGQVLARLSKPSKPTFLVAYSEDTLRLAQEIKDTYGLVDLEKIKEIYAIDESIKNKLNTLRHKYFCLSGLNTGERTVESILPDVVLKMESENVEEQPVVPKEIVNELAMLSTMIYFKDEVSTFVIPYVWYGLKKQWESASNMLGVNVSDLNQLTFTELINQLKNPTPIANLVEKRKQNTLFFHAPFTSTEIIEGEEAVREAAVISAQQQSVDYSSVKELKGKTGSVGRVTGTVQKILKSSEMGNFKEGNILVAVYTAPEFVPVMKKAIAVVTDTGGITCHAAIVSRELHKPCVVGTKIATQVLRDGDVVEVDADKGIVRKV